MPSKKLPSLCESMAEVERAGGQRRMSLLEEKCIWDDLSMYMGLCLVRAVLPATGKPIQWNLPEWIERRLGGVFGLKRAPRTVRDAIRADDTLLVLWDCLQGKASADAIRDGSGPGEVLRLARAEAKRWARGK